MKLMIFLMLLFPMLSSAQYSKNYELRLPSDVNIKSLICFKGENLEPENAYLWIEDNMVTLASERSEQPFPVKKATVFYFWRTHQTKLTISFNDSILSLQVVPEREYFKGMLGKSESINEDLKCKSLAY